MVIMYSSKNNTQVPPTVIESGNLKPNSTLYVFIYIKEKDAWVSPSCHYGLLRDKGTWGREGKAQAIITLLLLLLCILVLFLLQ